ncbi:MULTISPECIES: DUF3099 domain-containing protein [unclassified Pseudactinotalea]|uniref:DUF3099 domain-containing protein n=1 Tax=Micrococcales TaxID=85006 RepID=UPI003C7AD4F5
MPEVHSVTSAAEPLSVRNSRRMRRYLITMGIRCAGLVGAVYTEGWLRWVSIVLAVVLPYVAVALGSESVDKPTGATPYTEPDPQITASGRVELEQRHD